MHAHGSFVPAAGHDHFLPAYDPLGWWLGLDRARESFVEHAALAPGHRVLDVGAGTGTLAVFVKRAYPRVDVVGLDPDARALLRARRKAERASTSIRFDEGFANALPYTDGAFDRVFSTFMFHHLDAPTKDASAKEMRRVLAPGGELHLLDFAPLAPGEGGFLARRLPWNRLSLDNSVDRLVAILRGAGFARATCVTTYEVRFGSALHLVARDR